MTRWDDFTAKPGVANQYGLVQGVKNAIAPGKRPLVFHVADHCLKDGKPFLVVGSPGRFADHHRHIGGAG